MRRVFCGVVAMLATGLIPAGAVAADRGNAPPTLSFFSSGGGAHAGWIQTDDQPPVDTDFRQAIRIHVTPTGFAGVLVHHVYGTPTAEFPNSKFDFKSSLGPLPSQGYPRLVITFSDGGNASLRPLFWTTNWQTVADNNWDNNRGGCGFRFQTTWQEIQACHPGTFVTSAFITTDPGGPEVTFLIDNLEVMGKNFSAASDNSNGDNTTAVFTPDLLPSLL